MHQLHYWLDVLKKSLVHSGWKSYVKRCSKSEIITSFAILRMTFVCKQTGSKNRAGNFEISKWFSTTVKNIEFAWFFRSNNGRLANDEWHYPVLYEWFIVMSLTLSGEEWIVQLVAMSSHLLIWMVTNFCHSVIEKYMLQKRVLFL